MNFDIRYFMSICWRRLPLFIPVTLVFSVIAFVVAISLPAQFESSSRLLVESPQIDDKLARSTVDIAAAEQLQIIEQRLLTRPNLLEIARKYSALDGLNDMSPDKIVTQMRQRTVIRRMTGRNQATFMVVSFRAEVPQTAAAVVNEYVTLILNENSRYRKSRATGTLVFFEQEVEKLNRELDRQSAKILEFQSENSDALPSTLQYRLNRQGQLQERIALNERERLSLVDQRRRMVQLFEITADARARAPESRTREENELENLRADLAKALLVYSQDNPKVKLLQARIDQLALLVDDEKRATADLADPQEMMMTLQLEEIDNRISVLENQNAQTQIEIDEFDDSIERTPGNAIVLEALDRDYVNIQSQYNSAVDRLSRAATGERIEVLSKGERITVVEQPNVPIEPASPNRPVIAGGGSLLGVMLAAAAIVLLELSNRTIRRPVDLSNRFGVVPLGVLPVIRTPGDRLMKGAVMLTVVTVVVVGVPAALFMVHTYYLPLDLIAGKALAKLGI